MQSLSVYFWKSYSYLSGLMLSFMIVSLLIPLQKEKKPQNNKKTQTNKQNPTCLLINLETYTRPET